MKKIYILAVSVIAALCMCGCSGSSGDGSSSGDGNSVTAPEEKYDFYDEFAPGVSCVKSEDEVRLTVPPEYLKGLGLDNPDNIKTEQGFKEVITNDDGSTTLVLTNELHSNISEAMRLSLKFTVTQMDMADDYPNFKSVTSNDDFTRFDIVTAKDELSEEETMTIIDFLKISATYNSIAGNEIESCKVVFTNESTGKVVYEFDTADL